MPTGGAGRPAPGGRLVLALLVIHAAFAVASASAVTHYGVLFRAGTLSRGLLLASVRVEGSAGGANATLRALIVSHDCDRLVGREAELVVPGAQRPVASALVAADFGEQNAACRFKAHIFNWTSLVPSRSWDGVRVQLRPRDAAGAPFAAELRGGGETHRVALLSNAGAAPAPAFPFGTAGGVPFDARAVSVPGGTFGAAVLSAASPQAEEGTLTVYQNAAGIAHVRLAVAQRRAGAGGAAHYDASTTVADPACSQSDPAALRPCLPQPTARAGSGECRCEAGNAASPPSPPVSTTAPAAGGTVATEAAVAAPGRPLVDPAIAGPASTASAGPAVLIGAPSAPRRPPRRRRCRRRREECVCRVETGGQSVGGWGGSMGGWGATAGSSAPSPAARGPPPAPGSVPPRPAPARGRRLSGPAGPAQPGSMPGWPPAGGGPMSGGPMGGGAMGGGAAAPGATVPGGPNAGVSAPGPGDGDVDAGGPRELAGGGGGPTGDEGKPAGTWMPSWLGTRLFSLQWGAAGRRGERLATPPEFEARVEVTIPVPVPAPMPPPAPSRPAPARPPPPGRRGGRQRGCAVGAGARVGGPREAGVGFPYPGSELGGFFPAGSEEEAGLLDKAPRLLRAEPADFPPLS
eukprot:tig00001126_g7113.t1